MAMNDASAVNDRVEVLTSDRTTEPAVRIIIDELSFSLGPLIVNDESVIIALADSDWTNVPDVISNVTLLIAND